MRKNLLLMLLAALMLASCGNKKDQTKFEMPAVEDIVMYQVNPRVFAPEKSLQAVTARLDSIKALGVNVVWVMPIYPIGKEKTKNSPYSISDYKAVNPEFGTLDDFKALVDSCHAKGMGIILDWVANHTAWDNVWLKEGHKDWYTKDSTGNIVAPIPDWSDVADLNYDNKDMRRAMIDAMKFWVTEMGVDGFRCDVADMVPTDFWKEAISELRKAAGDRRLVMLAEGTKVENFTEGGFDMNYAWDFMHALFGVMDGDDVSALIKADSAEYAVLPEGKVKLRFTTNHDESTHGTPVTMFGNPEAAMAAYVVTTTLHGGALIYGSQEVDQPDSINFFHYVPVDWTSNQDTYHNFQQFFRIYNEHPALRKGELKPIYAKDGVIMYEKKLKNDRYLVFANLHQGDKVVIDIPEDWVGIKACNLLHLEEIWDMHPQLPLNSYNYFILKRMD